MPTHIIVKGMLSVPALITRGYLPSTSYGTSLIITSTGSGERTSVLTNGGELHPGSLGRGWFNNNSESGGEA